MSLTASGIAIFVFLVAGVSLLYPAPLTPKDEQVIKTAYMNGFVAAFDLDNETIRTMKGNEILLRQTVENSANRYLKRVKEMNK
jgi:hypothetical protein